MQNEAKKRHLPASLTSELEDHYRQGEQDLSEEINSIPSFSQTRELVLQRLGGPFEYSQFTENIRKLKVEREQLKRQFKLEQLWQPELGTEDFGG